MLKKKCCCNRTLYRLDPCYEPAPATCYDCELTGGTPRYITVEISGMQTGCCDRGTISDIVRGTWPSIIVCEHNCGPDPFGGMCKWYGYAAFNGRYSLYNGSDQCTGAEEPCSRDFYWAQVWIQATLDDEGGPIWKVYAFFNSDTGSPPEYYGYGEAWFEGTVARANCRASVSVPNKYTKCDGLLEDGNWWPKGSALLTMGDKYELAASTKCPGGSAIYTRTDLSGYVGKTIELEDYKCYAVSVETGDYSSDGPVTVYSYADNCSDCCSETGTYTQVLWRPV